jgi:hypothetical protein
MWMLHNMHGASVSYVCCKHFQMDVASVSYGCCKSSSRCCICFAMATHMFQVLSCVLQVFQMYVCKCFSFWTYVASVLSGCCKSKSGIAHVAMEPTYRNHLLQLLGHCRRSPCEPLRLTNTYVVCIHKQGRNWGLRGHKQRGKRSGRKQSPRVCVRKRSGVGVPTRNRTPTYAWACSRRGHPDADIRFLAGFLPSNSKKRSFFFL